MAGLFGFKGGKVTKAELDHGYYLVQRGTAAYKARNARGSRVRRAKLKDEVLAHYGPQGHRQCSWPGCLIDDVDMLSVDHLNDDGADDRRRHTGTSRGGGGQEMYRRLKREGFPDGFQTLCLNHQMKKALWRVRRDIILGRP